MTRKEFLVEYDTELKPVLNLFNKAAATSLSYRPRADMMTTGQVIFHMSHGLAEAIKFAQTGEWSYSDGAALPALEEMPTVLSIEEAVTAIKEDRSKAEEILDTISEEDFQNKFVETPWGMKGSFWRVAFMFLEHMKMHKMQLFLYLRIQGLSINTMDLY